MLQGWYYLHENGDLIYKRDLDGTAADIRESPFARALWPFDPEEREGAWAILIEASALGVNRSRVQELAVKWGCTDEDAQVYGNRVGVIFTLDGDQHTATRTDFEDLQESPCGFGNTRLEAMADLCRQLGYKGGKMWNASFKDLLK